MKKTIKDREAEFIKLCEPYFEKYGKKLIREFVDYWTEHNEPVTKITKMRFEKEKTFQASRRLSTWARNSNKWDAPKQENKNVGAMEILRRKHGMA